MLKKIKHLIEYSIFLYFLAIFKFLPFKISSHFGGLIVETLAIWLKANRIAKKNLKDIYPDLSKKRINLITKQIWNNLGRNIAEFPHITNMKKDEILDLVEIKNLKILDKYKNKPVLFVTAHYSNWEIANILLHHLGFKMNTIYRVANNNFIDKKIKEMRSEGKNINLFKKGKKESGRFLLNILKKQAGGMLIDQKYGEGIDIKFLGKEAKTSSFVANIAKKYEINIVPVCVKRKANKKYELIIEDPITKDFTKNKSELEIMLELNRIIESWINNDPSQWFWVHNRWS